MSRGFTLTEMLVVIAIISILAALASVAVVRGLDTAKQTRQKTEVDGLDAAFKAYKEKYGSYPPCDLRFRAGATAVDGSGNPDPYFNAALIQHVVRAFPRYPLNRSNLETQLRSAGVDTEAYRPDQAIVFWLNGFSTDVTNPFGNLAGLKKAQRTPRFFDFDETRLAVRDTRNWMPPPSGIQALPSYFPNGPKISTTAVTPSTYSNTANVYPDWDSGSAPYVYIDAHATPVKTASIVSVPFYGMPPTAAGQPAVTNPFNAASTPSLPFPAIPGREVFPGAGTVMAYWNDLNGNSHCVTSGALDAGEDFMNADSFQIIGPGGDGKYGTAFSSTYACARMYPTGNTELPSNKYELSDDEDNVTNFCPRARLGDAKP